MLYLYNLIDFHAKSLVFVVTDGIYWPQTHQDSFPDYRKKPTAASMYEMYCARLRST